MAVSTTIGPRRRPFTVEEYRRMGEAGIFGTDDRIELIEGEIVQMTPIGSRHAGHVRRVASLFRGIEPDEAIVSVQNPVQLGEYSEPEPDIALLHPRGNFYEDAHPGPGDIFVIVEVAETSVGYDRDTKIPLYAEHDIPAVWLLNLEEEHLEVFSEPVDGEYTVIRKPSRDDVVTIPELDDRTFRAGELFV